MTTDVPIPQTIAMFENGESKEDALYFDAVKDENGFLAVAEPEKSIYKYKGEQSDQYVNGTIVVRNMKTGEFKMIPVDKIMQIRRKLKLQQQTSTSVSDPKTEELIEKFGTRAAQRIIKQRHMGGQ